MNVPEPVSTQETVQVARVATPDAAAAVSAFLLQPGLFGTPLTPGERDEFQARPAASVGVPDETYWLARDGQGGIAGVLGVRAHVCHAGIFEVSALAVAATHRRQGLGRRLLERGLDFVAAAGGRGLIFETSSDPSYVPMHHLLAELGFAQVGRFPDFYFPGEDALWYYRAITR
jgi:ribosomal protein S18 acetylase RimI-like enzyme